MKKKTFLFAMGCIVNGCALFAQDTIVSLRVDSTLTVGDSAFFNKSVMMLEDATTSRDLTVEGDLYARNRIYYPNAPALSGDFEDKDIILFDHATGLLEKSSLQAVQDQLYTKHCYQVNGVIEHPTWSNLPNTIFVDCPDVNVGIGDR
jgi:hypothetical protein